MFETNKSVSSTGVKSKIILSHKQIEDRAKAIWLKKGCPVGQDDKNWLEAEAQLRRELSVSK